MLYHLDFTTARRSDDELFGQLCPFVGVYSLTYIGLLLFRHIGFRYLSSSKAYSILLYTSFVVFGCHSVSSLIVVLGIRTDSVIFLFPFIFTAVVCMCHAAITICLVFITELQQNGEIGALEASISVYHIINIVITLYCLLCVFSQTQDFMRGKGTARYYRRRRCRRQRRAALVQEASVLDQHLPPLPFPFNELYNNLVPYPGPSPCVQPPSYVDEPPPYSTLPRPETPRQSMPCPSNADGDVSGLFTPDTDAASNACAASGDVSVELTEVGGTQDCSDNDSCQNETTLSEINRLTEVHRPESLSGDEQQEETCNTLCDSTEPNVCDEIAPVASAGSNSILMSSGISTLSAAQTTSIVLWEDPSAECYQCDGVVATCDNTTHI